MQKMYQTSYFLKLHKENTRQNVYNVCSIVFCLYVLCRWSILPIQHNISLSENHHFDSKQASSTEELNVLYKLSQIKFAGTVKTKWQPSVCRTSTVNGQNHRGVEEEFEHMCESASRCSAQLLSPHCAPACAGETQAHVETPIRETRWGGMMGSHQSP